MPHAQHPRVFISYRHGEHRGIPDAEARNRAHVVWVEQFARDLASLRVEPVLDARIRILAGNLFGSDPVTEPAIANLALASIHCCHAFLPVITPGWVERIGYANFEPQRTWADGYVFDEWQQAAASASAGRIQIIPLMRGGRLDQALNLPFVLNAGILFDFTDDARYEDNVVLLAQYLHNGRTVARPAVDKKLGDWLVEFLKAMLEKGARGND
jgi:hypothetical protein